VVRAASIIALMMEAARTSETSVDIQLRTLQYIPEDSELRKMKMRKGKGKGMNNTNIKDKRMIKASIYDEAHNYFC
jgi:hypothetical protein